MKFNKIIILSMCFLASLSIANACDNDETSWFTDQFEYIDKEKLDDSIQDFVD